MSTSQPPRLYGRTFTLANLLGQLADLGYPTHDLPAASIALWSRGSRTGQAFKLVCLSPSIGNVDSKIALFTAVIEEGMIISVCDAAPHSEKQNESSLLSSVWHNGHRTHYAADINVAVMRDLNEHYERQVRLNPASRKRSVRPRDGWLPLEADTFKWPHMPGCLQTRKT